MFKTEGNKDPAPSGTGIGGETDYAKLFNSGTVLGNNFNFGNVLSNTQRYASNNDLFDDATTILSNTQLRSANFINGWGEVQITSLNNFTELFRILCLYQKLLRQLTSW